MGVGKSDLENVISDEIVFFNRMDNFLNTQGFDIYDRLNERITSALWYDNEFTTMDRFTDFHACGSVKVYGLQDYCKWT